MVRFSCFSCPSHKPKRTLQLPLDTMDKTLEGFSQNQTHMDHINSASFLNPLPIGIRGDYVLNDSVRPVEVNVKMNTGLIKKSYSLGNDLDQHVSRYSCDDWHELKGNKYGRTSSVNEYYEARVPPESPQVSSVMVNDSIFSTRNSPNLEKDANENSLGNGDSGEVTSSTLHVIEKACSVPDIATNASAPYTVFRPHCRSSEDLHVLQIRQKEKLVDEVRQKVRQEQEKYTLENNSVKDWIVPVIDELNTGKYIKGEFSGSQWNSSPNKDSKIKRIEEWVMDIPHFNPLEEQEEKFVHDEAKRVPEIADGFVVSKFDNKGMSSMEAAKKYISSLSGTATVAQLTNHGLVMIPFLSASVSLRVLNLSGNAIARITAGVLPRGLHALNLSKNNISIIEGLRELSRLRVLDLSYNRIFRIGHGVSSCSSLKELYLAGNKINEVEGLHRLLKLNVLDLRFNKISTTRSLGELAANYKSLQAISLEGNPAQKNVGDEPLRKHLQGLLPQLSHYNRQLIKNGSYKDTLERSTRLGTSHQFDRGLRSEQRPLRKTTHKTSSSMIAQGRMFHEVVSPKLTKGGKHLKLPLSRTKGTLHDLHHNVDFGNTIRRSRSVGTLNP